MDEEIFGGESLEKDKNNIFFNLKITNFFLQKQLQLLEENIKFLFDHFMKFLRPFLERR